MKRILYLTFDGLLEPLGTSQIVRPLMALSQRGYRYTVASLEKPGDLEDVQRVEALRQRLSDAGIRWVFGSYARGGVQGVGRNVASLFALAHAERDDVQLLHPRAHLSAAVAWALRSVTGLPYLFDFRGYWVDEQRAQGRWVTHPAAYALAKQGERRLIGDARAVVTLTDLASEDVRRGVLGPFGPDRTATTITTVADYDEFTREGPVDAVPAEVRSALEGKLVVAYIGAINVSYAYEEAMRLFSKLAERREDAHLLCITRQTDAMKELLARHGITEATVTSAEHRDMAQWLRLIDWALLLLNEPYAKRGSMPTKLGELFAAEVRITHSGCNREVCDWVRRAGSGIVLDTLDDAALELVAERMATEPRDEAATGRARALTEEHFGLAAGVERYARLLGDLTAGAPPRAPRESRIHA